MKRLIVLTALIVAMTACENDALRQTQSVNNNVKVDVLTEFEGIRVYRVHDGGYPIYIAVRDGNITAQWRENHGKTSVERSSVTLP